MKSGVEMLEFVIASIIPTGLAAKTCYNVVVRSQLLQHGIYRNYMIKNTGFVSQCLDVTGVKSEYSFNGTGLSLGNGVVKPTMMSGTIDEKETESRTTRYHVSGKVIPDSTQILSPSAPEYHSHDSLLRLLSGYNHSSHPFMGEKYYKCYLHTIKHKDHMLLLNFNEKHDNGRGKSGESDNKMLAIANTKETLVWDSFPVFYYATGTVLSSIACYTTFAFLY